MNTIQLYNANKTLVDSSGNLYNSNLPPLTFGFTVFGLENHAQYYTKANLVTINGTTVETDFVRFYTNYETVPEKTSFTATLDSCNGYVNLHSGMICNITGESNPEIPTYIGGTKIDLRSAVADINEVDEFGVANAKWAKWNHDLFTIPKSFLLRLWFYPARQPFEVIRLCNNTNTSYLTVSLRRDTTQDYISIRTDNGTTKDIPLNMFCNGNTKMFLWIKIIESSWTVQLSVLETEATVLDWNDTLNNNISFNVTSDVTFVGETYESFTPSSDNFEELSDEFTTVIVGNGVFDHMNVTKDTTISYTTDFPSWTDDTVLNVDFNNSIVASPHYSKLVLKRRDDTLLTWLNLSELEVQPNIATYINFNDSFIPTGIKQ